MIPLGNTKSRTAHPPPDDAQADHEHDGTDNDPPVQPRPVAVGAEFRPSREHIAARQTDAPEREHGEPERNRDILVAAQCALWLMPWPPVLLPWQEDQRW